MNPFVFVVIACVPWHPFCIGPSAEGVGIVMQSDPIEREACFAKLEQFVTRMKRAAPRLDGFYFGQCRKDGTDV